MQRPLVWLAGAAGHGDFAPALAWLDEVARIQPAGDDGPARRGDFPAAIVLCQSRPGELSQDQIEALHRRAPLARLLVLCGPWCAGELRSGRPCQGVTRIHWHQWPLRLPPELGLGPAGSTAGGYRPRTLSETDLLLRTLTPALRRAPQGGLVAICASSRESFSALADVCWAAGLRSVWQQPGFPPQHVGADVLLMDGWHGQSAATQRSAQLPPAVLLLDWVESADLDQAARLGISRVLAKPLLIADLWAAFDSLLGRLASQRGIPSAA